MNRGEGWCHHKGKLNIVNSGHRYIAGHILPQRFCRAQRARGQTSLPHITTVGGSALRLRCIIASGLILLMVSILIALGCVMETTPNVMILAPILKPLDDNMGMKEV